MGAVAQPSAALMVGPPVRGQNSRDEAVMNAGLKDGGDRQYRALLLDFGTVIQKSFFETRADIETLLQIQPGTLTWAGPFDPGSDPLWRQVVTGAFPGGVTIGISGRGRLAR